MLDTNQIDGWWLDVERVKPDQWPLLENLLEEHEIERSKRFHFEHDRLSYIAAHALMRTLLTKWSDIAPSDWRFEKGTHGKPEAIIPDGSPTFRVNIAHTRGMVAGAVTVDNDLGVDIEWLGRKNDIDALAQRVLTEEEREQIAKTPLNQKQRTFLTFWTLKEAYVKAIGKGLSKSLDSFYFDLVSLKINFKTEREGFDGDNPAHWRIEHIVPGDNHLISIAAQHSNPQDIDVSIKETSVDNLLQFKN